VNTVTISIDEETARVLYGIMCANCTVPEALQRMYGKPDDDRVLQNVKEAQRRMYAALTPHFHGNWPDVLKHAGLTPTLVDTVQVTGPSSSRSGPPCCP
jgi:hypothetical protein